MTASGVSEIVVATGNKRKLAELQTVADRFGLKLLSPQDCRDKFGLGEPPDVVECGETFAANALLKAHAYAAWAKIPALGDDSGLEVDALGGRPGVRSARYAGGNATDADRIQKLVGELAGVTDRRARFRCALALVSPKGRTLEAEGTLEGEILEQERGTKGFGYDPIVYLYDLKATLAEVEFERTCREGFRARAAQKLFVKMTQCRCEEFAPG